MFLRHAALLAVTALALTQCRKSNAAEAAPVVTPATEAAAIRVTVDADVLQELWSGKMPANRAPDIRPVQGVPPTALTADSPFEASVQATDPEGDPLAFHWSVLPEPKSHDGSKAPPMPKAVAGTIANPSGDRVAVKAPAKPGIYRLHVWVKDGKGHAATANMPFEVK